MTRPIAISKKVAVSDVSEKVEALIEKAIGVINSKLADFTDGTYRQVYIREIGLGSASSEVTTRVCLELVKVFKAQGWNVRYETGTQHDPEVYLQFS